MGEGDVTSTSRAADEFAKLAGHAPAGVWSAPGRANLIGEHTDYNGGYVLPFAIDRRTSAAVALRADGVARCFSVGRGAAEEVRLDDVSPQTPPKDWAGYPIGVAWALRQAGVAIPGFDLVVDSTVPGGAGVSSSAALEAATALGLLELVGADLPRPEIALACQRAENEIVGAPTGVMDQMAVLLGTADHALFLDCRSLESTLVPLVLGDLALLLLDTHVKHALADGQYGARRAACERVAAAVGVPLLRDASLADVLAADVSEEDRRRARHVVAENERVLRTVELLEADQEAQVGPLLSASHASLRDDFEVSCPELDSAAEAAERAGALGARMVGGGFGGSVLALVPKASVPDVVDAVQAAAGQRGFPLPEPILVAPAAGAGRES
jgi:galactokinase